LVNRHNVSKILKPQLKDGNDYATLNRKTWYFLHTLYGGGPEIRKELNPVNILPPNLE